METFDYFCGADISIYMENTWIEDAIFLSYELSNTKRPLYGYASQYFDTVLPGRVLVTGQLIIAYTDKHYLPAITGAMSEASFKSKFTNPKESFEVTEETILTELKKLDFKNFQSKAIDLQNQYWKDNAFEGMDNDSSDRAYKNALNLSNATDRKTIYIGTSDQVNGVLAKNTIKKYKMIHDVHFTSESFQVDVSGEPIVQVYQFFAHSLS